MFKETDYPAYRFPDVGIQPAITGVVADLVEIHYGQEASCARATVQPLSWLMEKEFGEQDTTWISQVVGCGDHILSSLATIHINHDKNADLYPGDGIYRKFAELHGSMARAIMGNSSACSNEAANVLLAAQAKHKGKLQNITQEIFDGTTWIWDMDIVIDPHLSLEAILDELRKKGVQIFAQDQEAIRLEFPVSDGNSVNGSLELIDIGRAKAARIIISPENGPRFSFDIIPQAEEPAADFRVGPQNSNKRNFYIDFAVARSQEGQVDVGISGNPEDLLRRATDIRKPSEVENPDYQSVEQAIIAFLGYIRTEIGSPTDPNYRERFAGRISDNITELAVTEFQRNFLLNAELSDYRVKEMMREWLVLLCSDKSLALQMVEQSHLDSFLRIEQDVITLGNLSQEDIRQKIVSDPSFVDYAAGLFDLSDATTRPNPIDTWSQFFFAKKGAGMTAEQLSHARNSALGEMRSDVEKRKAAGKERVRMGLKPSLFDYVETSAIGDIPYVVGKNGPLPDGSIVDVFALPIPGESAFYILVSGDPRNKPNLQLLFSKTAVLASGQDDMAKADDTHMGLYQDQIITSKMLSLRDRQSTLSFYDHYARKDDGLPVVIARYMVRDGKIELVIDHPTGVLPSEAFGALMYATGNGEFPVRVWGEKLLASDRSPLKKIYPR